MVDFLFDGRFPREPLCDDNSTCRGLLIYTPNKVLPADGGIYHGYDANQDKIIYRRVSFDALNLGKWLQGIDQEQC